MDSGGSSSSLTSSSVEKLRQGVESLAEKVSKDVSDLAHKVLRETFLL